MKRNFFYLFVPVLLFILAGAGCAQSRKTAQNNTQEQNANSMIEVNTTENKSSKTVVFDITGKNYSFSVNEIKVKKGDKVKINFTSKEGIHNWVVDEFNAKTKTVSKNGQTSVEFNADKVGTFEFFCSVGNHRKKGMIGKIIVEDAPSPAMKEEVMKKEATTMSDIKFTGNVLGGNVAKVYDFNNDDYQKALKSDKLIVLYFYASWCPLCRAEFPQMTSAFDGLNTDKVVGFRVNYNDPSTDSSEKALAKQYGIAYQHTKIFVQNNKQVLKSPETWDKARYSTEINKIVK